MKSANGYVIEVYIANDNNLHITTTDNVSPRLIQLGIGEFAELKLSKKIVADLIESVGEVISVVLPANIPTGIIELLIPFMELDCHKHMVSPGQTGFDAKAYHTTIGHVPDEIPMHPYKKEEVVEMKPVYPYDGQFLQPVPRSSTGQSPPKLGNTISHDDGFVELDMSNVAADVLDTVPGGFYSADKLPADVQHPSDGFHELESYSETVSGQPVDVEKREMWSEDPERMNRLGYLVNAAMGDFDTFPKELGGGRIPGR